MYIVAVEFKIRPVDFGRFLDKVRLQARNSVSLEPDCHQFDVCVPEGAPSTVFLYEVYSDGAAFDLHLASDHFRDFDEETRDWVENKTVRVMERLEKAA